MPAIEFFMVAGNVIALIGGAVALVRWFRNWLVKQVAEPIESMRKELLTQQSDVKRVEQTVNRAHQRIDQLVRGHHA